MSAMRTRIGRSPLSGCIAVAAALAGFLLSPSSMAGSWTKLANLAPGGVQMLLLLSDGSVMAQNTAGNNWYRLTPDIHGSYINGGWTSRASMSSTRLYYSSAVLRDGNVFVAGAEYGNGWLTAERYDPSNDTWTSIPVPPALLNTNNTAAASGPNLGGFSDSGCKILSDGRVLVAPVYPTTNNGTLIYDPGANSCTPGPPARGSQNEASWVKLPDESILTIDKSGVASERYIPSLNRWIADANAPANIYDTFAEVGAGLLLPNGKAFFLGGNGQTLIYTPSGNTNQGSWITGPLIPAGLAAPDAAAAMMPNGKLLCAVSAPLYATNILGTNSTFYPQPTSFYEYDYVDNIFRPISGPTNAVHNIKAYQSIFLDLPDGNVLFSDNSTQLYIYRPDIAALPPGRPAISSIVANSDGSFHLVGTGLNGISEGAAYGDDAQMDSNYPLVRLTDGGGNVAYATTYNWSSTGVATGNKPVSTEFYLPPGYNLSPGTYSLEVVANGFASPATTFYGPIWVDFNYGGVTQDGSYFSPYGTLSQGVGAVAPGGTIFIKPGGSPQTMTISKPMTIVAIGGPATIGR